MSWSAVAEPTHSAACCSVIGIASQRKEKGSEGEQGHLCRRRERENVELCSSCRGAPRTFVQAAVLVRRRRAEDNNGKNDSGL